MITQNFVKCKIFYFHSNFVFMSEIPQSVDANSSSLGENFNNKISLDVLFANLNQTLKNKFNTTNDQSKSDLKLNGNKDNINFFNYEPNCQSTNLKVFSNSFQNLNPGAIQFQTIAEKNTTDPNKKDSIRNNGNNFEIFYSSQNKDFLFKSIPKSNLPEESKTSPNFPQELSSNQQVQHQSHLYNFLPLSNVSDQNKQMHPSFSTSLSTTSAQTSIPSNTSYQNEIKSDLSFQNFAFTGKDGPFLPFKQISPSIQINFPCTSQHQNHFNESNNFDNALNNSIGISNNNGFNDLSKFKISPSKLNFFPTEVWASNQDEVTLEDLISSFFHARCSSKIRFEHKLWNSLQITRFKPQLFYYIGIRWVSKTIIQVNQEAFGNFLDLKKAASTFFTSKGYFPSHGFIEIPKSKIRENINEDIVINETDDCRYLEHIKKSFRMDSTENEIASIQLEGLPDIKSDSLYSPSSLSNSSKDNNIVLSSS